jgi:two-component system nitrogen regulation sensor histidine kinase NtrY
LQQSCSCATLGSAARRKTANIRDVTIHQSQQQPDGGAAPVAGPRLDERRISGVFGPIAVGGGLVLALATFVTFAGFTPIIPTQNVVLILLGGDGVIVVCLLVLIALEMRRLRAARRAARAGARLHNRVVALFSLVAAIPALVTALIATVSVEWVINPAFMKDVSSFLSESGALSQVYGESQCRTLLREAELTANDLSQASRLVGSDPNLFQNFLTARARALGFSAAAVIKSDGASLAQAAGSDPKQIAKPDTGDFAAAAAKEPYCGLLGGGQVFVALRPIAGIDNGYFYAARAIDPMSGRVARDAMQVSAVFANFESHRHNIELGFAAVFVMLSLTMLISAVWMGLTFANQLVGPIRRLIRATDEVASGNLYVQVPTRRSEGDLGHLGETFNKMTMELRHQRNRLTDANALNDERRAFIEAVLSGVPASIIGVDSQDVITVSNAAADALLCDDDPRGLVGRNIGEVFPQVAQILDQARTMNLRSQQAQATWTSRGRERLLNVRVTGDPQRGHNGAVVTLDDISDLVTAQRSAAWADVARRIAHEIKNPLTPIQLSAERLKRRYGKHIVEGKDVFDQCTDTIIRQVDDIKRMVDEFSSFARMPKARPAKDDLSDCVRQALFLMRLGRPDIAFEDDLPAEPVIADFDRRLISQALTNVLKNAGEGIDALGEREEKARILATLAVDDGVARITVSDNGKGFPSEDRRKLIEPYVTTRAEGTGLGLPIVIKIFEDHHGEVELLDGLERADGGRGAQVLMKLPLRFEAAAAAAAPAASNAPLVESHIDRPS